MTIEGYIRKRPDTSYWEAQIHAGIEFRKKFAYEQEWDKWRAFYRGNWAPGVMPVNLFYMFLRSIVPRTYFRDPTVSISPAKPGAENLLFARLLERVDNKMIKRMKFKQKLKGVVQDTFLLGTGVAKLGFGGFYSPTILDDEPGPPLTGEGAAVEYFTGTDDFMPWVARTPPGNFIVPAGITSFDHARWTIEEFKRPLDDIQRDPRLENTAGLQGTENREVTDSIDLGNIIRPVKMVKLFEVRDKATGKVFVYAPDHSKDDKILFFDDDRFLLTYGGFNHFPTIFNDDDEAFWGLPDSKILEPLQLELNEIKTQIMRHRRIALVKFLIKKKGMKKEEAEKMVSEDVGVVAWVEGQGDINKLVMEFSASIPPELFVAADTLMQDVREQIGFSRNQFGEFNSRSGDTTATEANIVKQATEIRIDERRDVMADTVVDIVEMMHGVLFDNWGEEQIVDVIGPGGVPIWIRVRGELLKRGKFSVKVDPDSSVPETKGLREQRAIQLFQFLRENPLIDPIKLTMYLMTELKGPAFDDMMQMLPQPGMQPDRPIEVNDFAEIMKNSIGQLQQAPRPKQLASQPAPGNGAA